MYAYIDESGDTGITSKSTKNFILVASIIKDEDIFPRLAKKVFSKNIKIKKKKHNQLHAYHDDKSTHKRISNGLGRIDFKVIYINNKDYFFCLKKMFARLREINVHTVFLAKRDNRKSVYEKVEGLGKENNLKIIQTTPTANKGLQIADFVSWAIFKNIEYSDNAFFKKFENKIL